MKRQNAVLDYTRRNRRKETSRLHKKLKQNSHRTMNTIGGVHYESTVQTASDRFSRLWPRIGSALATCRLLRDWPRFTDRHRHIV
jgi:hypothetical protein